VATKTKPNTNGTGKSATADTGSTTAITLTPIREETIEVPIVGRTPVIPHKWSEKAKRIMLEAQQGRPRQKKEPKDPAAEAEAATYWLPDGRPGMPATAFKAAVADAARWFDGVTITDLKQCIWVRSTDPDDTQQLIAIEGDLSMREDTPRNANGGADLRYRNQIWPWEATLTIGYVATKLTAEAVVALVDAAGRGGVGDWRPSAPKSKTGTYGTFRVAS
jgi:hypothetical protein